MSYGEGVASIERQMTGKRQVIEMIFGPLGYMPLNLVKDENTNLG